MVEELEKWLKGSGKKDPGLLKEDGSSMASDLKGDTLSSYTRPSF